MSGNFNRPEPPSGMGGGRPPFFRSNQPLNQPTGHHWMANQQPNSTGGDPRPFASMRGQTPAQKPGGHRHRHQKTKSKRNQICSNCFEAGHSLRHCFKADSDGFLSGCPRCGDRTHDYDECQEVKLPNDDLLYLLKHRSNKPLIRSRIDVRTIDGFYGENMNVKWMPWTPDFTKRFMAERPEYYKEHKFELRWEDEEYIVDPAWKTTNWDSDWEAGYLAFTYPNGPVKHDPIKQRQGNGEYQKNFKKPRRGPPSSSNAQHDPMTHSSYSNAYTATQNPHIATAQSHMNHLVAPPPTPAVASDSYVKLLQVTLEHERELERLHLEHQRMQNKAFMGLVAETVNRPAIPLREYDGDMKHQRTHSSYSPATSLSESTKKRKPPGGEDKTDQHSSKRPCQELQYSDSAEDDPRNPGRRIKSESVKTEPTDDNPPNFWRDSKGKHIKTESIDDHLSNLSKNITGALEHEQGQKKSSLGLIPETVNQQRTIPGASTSEDSTKRKHARGDDEDRAGQRATKKTTPQQRQQQHLSDEGDDDDDDDDDIPCFSRIRRDQKRREALALKEFVDRAQLATPPAPPLSRSAKRIQKHQGRIARQEAEALGVELMDVDKTRPPLPKFRITVEQTQDSSAIQKRISEAPPFPFLRKKSSTKPGDPTGKDAGKQGPRQAEKVSNTNLPSRPQNPSMPLH